MNVMTIWAVFAVMTGAAVLAVLWPLSRARRESAVVAGDDDVAFYKAQLADIARDRERGIIGEAEAKAARDEAARRLLNVSRSPILSPAVHCEGALRRRRAASAIALSMIPLVSLGLYGALGSPHLPARPLADVMAERGENDLFRSIARIESHLAATPGDAKGWALLGPIYLRMGRAADAANAYRRIIEIEGESAPRLLDYAQAQIAADGGIVNAPARRAIDKGLELAPADPQARFLSALTLEQDGKEADARRLYGELLANAPADAPWRAMVEQRLAGLAGSQPSAETPR